MNIKHLIVTLWMLGFVSIAIAAAANPFASNTSSPRASRISAGLYSLVIALSVLGLGCWALATALFFAELWQDMQ